MEDAVRLLLEKDRIIDIINQLFIATDKRDWPQVRGCFADTVLFDMTSLGGGTAGDLTPEQIALGWEEGLAADRSDSPPGRELSRGCAGRSGDRILLRHRVTLPNHQIRPEYPDVRGKLRRASSADGGPLVDRRLPLQPQVCGWESLARDATEGQLLPARRGRPPRNSK